MVILTSFPPPTEGIKVEQPNTEAHVGNRRFGNGTLYIAESRLSWMGSNGRGFSLEYPAISLHAVSRDHRVYPQECLYLMIDAKLDDATEDNPTDHADEDDDEGLETDDRDDITEIRFIPEDRGVLDALFHAMSECQTLHPDPADSSSNDEDQDEAYDDGDDDDEAQTDSSGQNGTVIGSNGNTGLHGQRGGGGGGTGEPMDTSQFEDADAN